MTSSKTSPGDLLFPAEHRPTWIDVDLSRLAENLSAVRAHVGPSKIMAVVKANAYGHGLTTCAKHWEQMGVDCFGVAFVEEGIALRDAGIKSPILVLGGISGSQIPLFFKHDLAITASSVSKLEAIEEAARAKKQRAKVHLKIDTGMERIGVHYYNADSLFEKAACCPHVDVEGVYSHLATGEEVDTTFLTLQLERFLESLRFYEKRSLPLPCRHIANSGALLQLKETHLDLVRPGIILYGVAPARHLIGKLAVRPALSLRSTVVYFKVVKKDASVSYGRSWSAPHDTRVVTIPIGYGDGFSRAFSDRGKVLIRGKRYPIVGTVCMDQLMVNIGADGTAYNGDEVILIGKQGEEEVSVLDLAERIGTVPHEILTGLNTRVPRRYVGGV